MAGIHKADGRTKMPSNYLRSGNETAFARMLIARWQANSMHQAEFCRLVQLPAGWVQQIRNGSKTMPLDRVNLFANALGLNARERELFRDLAAVTHIGDHAARQRIERMIESAHAAVKVAMAS